MHKAMIAAAAFAALVAVPTAASAQASTMTGVAVGAGTGAIVGGPIGAIVGGAIGGTLGAASEPQVQYDERIYVEPRANVGATQRVCWREGGRRVCEYR